jgi:hypothetical protein
MSLSELAFWVIVVVTPLYLGRVLFSAKAPKGPSTMVVDQTRGPREWQKRERRGVHF